MRESELIPGAKYTFCYQFVKLGWDAFNQTEYFKDDMIPLNGYYIGKLTIPHFNLKYFAFALKNENNDYDIYYANLRTVTYCKGTTKLINYNEICALKLFIQSTSYMDYINSEGRVDSYSGLYYYHMGFTPNGTIDKARLVSLIRLVEKALKKVGYFMLCAPPKKKFSGGILYKHAYQNSRNLNNYCADFQRI